MWKRVTVNLEDHIKVVNLVDLENYNEQFDNYVSKIATSPLPLNKPLWEVHIINCPKVHTSPGVFILKLHHGIGDGISLMGIVFSGFKRVDDPSLPISYPSKSRNTTPKTRYGVASAMINMLKSVPRFISTAMYSLSDFRHSVMLLLFEDTKSPIRSGTTDMIRPFSTRICAVDLPLNDVKTIKTLLGVTVNDVIVGIIFYATRLYIQETNKELPKDARSTATVLVNTRKGKQRATKLEEMHEEKAWGNRISTFAIPLPKLEDDDLTNSLKFIKRTHKIVKAKRRGVYGPLLMGLLLGAVKTIAGLQTAARAFERMGWKNSSFGITNIVGPVEQVSVGNHRVKNFYFAPVGGNLSLVVSVMSYMENLRLGLIIEKDFINPQKLSSCVENAFQLIFEAALATSKSTI